MEGAAAPDWGSQGRLRVADCRWSRLSKVQVAAIATGAPERRQRGSASMKEPVRIRRRGHRGREPAWACFLQGDDPAASRFDRYGSLHLAQGSPAAARPHRLARSGLQPFKLATRVQIPLGTPLFSKSYGDFFG